MVARLPLAALRAESARLSAVLAGLPADRWARPTRCEPWDAAALVAHITQTLERVHPMLEADPPAEAAVDAAGYYRADRRFSAEVDADRVDRASDRAAAAGGGPALAAEFAGTWRSVTDRCAGAGAGRLVTTRHGDAMTLEDFLVTRVFEVAVHGIDLADAVGLGRWTTGWAAAVVADLLGPGLDGLERSGWDPVAFIAAATGRDRLGEAERSRLERLGLVRLALG